MSKINFWTGKKLKIAKIAISRNFYLISMENINNKNFMKLIYLISRVFCQGVFKFSGPVCALFEKISKTNSMQLPEIALFSDFSRPTVSKSYYMPYIFSVSHCLPRAWEVPTLMVQAMNESAIILIGFFLKFIYLFLVVSYFWSLEWSKNMAKIWQKNEEKPCSSCL